MAGKPKGSFYVALGVVVLGLVAFAVYQSDIFFPEEQDLGTTQRGEVKLDDFTPEAPDGKRLASVEQYTKIPGEGLPPPEGTAAYQALADNTVRFSLNVWAGWGPIILANNGFKAGKVWKNPDGDDFKVELVLIDDPVAMRDAYAAGQVHIGWATLDMVPLFMDGFVRANDPLVMPRIYQQIDWSNGGDGIVVRESIKTVRDLRGKEIVLAKNSPSEYFALFSLVTGGVQPSEVKWTYTATAFEAARAFEVEKQIAAAVSWAPDIYNLAEAKGNRMLVTTATANKLIADVWFARADFARDHPGICEGLVRGIFDAMEDLKLEQNKQRCAQLMAEGYGIPADEVLSMFADAHSTNWGENFEFFLNKNNPTNFESIWNSAYDLYWQIGSIQQRKVSPFEVMDARIIDKLGQEEKYRRQKPEYGVAFVHKDPGRIRAEADEILTNTIVIRFAPNDWDPHRKITREVDGQTVEELYDPNVPEVLKQAAQRTETFGAARIIIEGHTDSSMRGQVPEGLVKELSMNRANGVKEALVKEYSLDPDRFSVDGFGWDRPADPDDQFNHAKNRRVEIKVYSAEAQ